MLYVYLLTLTLILWSVDCQMDPRRKEIERKLLEGLRIKPGSFQELDQCLNTLTTELQLRESLIAKLASNIDKIWVTNQPQKITAKVIVDGTVTVRSQLHPQKVIITNPLASILNDQYPDLPKRLNQTTESVNRIADQLENHVVRKDRAEQRINGTIHFLSPIKADRIRIKTIKPSTSINGISWDELKNNVLRRSGHQTVTGRWNFNNQLYVKNLKVNGLLSGINISNILVANSVNEQKMTGRLNISQASFDSLNFDSVNGIPKSDLVFLSHHDQVNITGSKRFAGKINSAENIKLTGNLNGRNWKHLVKNSININSPGHIPSTLRFATPPVINNLEASLLNDMPIKNLKAGLRPEELVNLSGHKTFRSLVASKVTLNGKLNGFSVPDDFITLRELQNVTAPITFIGAVSFVNNLRVDTINSVNINTDTVLRVSKTPQIIRGTKIFDNNVQVNNLRSSRTNLRHINLDTLDPKEPNGAQFTRRSNIDYDESLTIDGDLKVKKINGFSIDQIINSLFLRSRDQKIFWPVVFQGNLNIDSVDSNTINGLKVHSDLVQVDTNGGQQIITGRKTFNKLFLEPNSELITTGNILNGKDLRSFENAIIRNDPAKKKDCYGSKHFSSVKVNGNVFAEKVNGLDLQRDVLLVNRPANVTGRLVFSSGVYAFQASFPSGLRVKEINNEDVNEALNRLVLQDEQSVKLENKNFAGGIEADEIVLEGKINGVNITKLLDSVVSLNTSQAINSPLRFEDEVTFVESINARTINGHDLHNNIMNALNGNSPTGNFKIIGNVKINGDIVTGSLNKHPRELIRNHFVQPRVDNNFDRPVIFNNNVTIEYLSVDDYATIDGVHPGDLLPLDKPIHLDLMKIRGVVKVDHRLIVQSGKINNCSIPEIIDHSKHRNRLKPLKIKHSVDFTNVNILGNLQVIDKINNVNFRNLINQVHIMSPQQKFNSSFTFASDVYADELYVSGPINGVDVLAIYDDSVKKSARHQIISGHKVFKSVNFTNLRFT